MMSWWVLVPTGILAVLSIGALIWKGGGWYGSVNTDRKNFREFMDEIRQDIKMILDRLPARGVASDSPLRLTEHGKQMSEKVNAEQWAEGIALQLLGSARDRPEWEVDRLCLSRIKNPATEEERTWLVESVGILTYEFGTDDEDVHRVLQVVLRDAVLGKLAKSGTIEDGPPF